MFSSPTNFSKCFATTPVIPDRTGASQATALFDVTQEWGVQHAPVGQVFDTTPSNTGRVKGASSRLEVLLDKPMMWLACQHHTGELHIFWLYKECRGKDVTKAPANKLFKCLHDVWPRLNKDNLVLWQWRRSVGMGTKYDD